MNMTRIQLIPVQGDYSSVKEWNGADTSSFDAFWWLLTKAGMKELMGCFRYAPIKLDTRKPDTMIDSGSEHYQLNNNTCKYPGKLGHHLLKPGTNYVIKSDTGTGKTTTFKHYVRKYGLDFHSVVSRCTLGIEQYVIFNEHGIECVYYEDFDFNSANGSESVVTTVDSLLKLNPRLFDFSNSVVFFDEFNSLVEYVLDSDTLRKSRATVLQRLIYVISNAKQVICADAHISDLCFKLLDFCGLKYENVQNTYNHNNDVRATEVFSYGQLIERMGKEREFLVCCDSATVAKAIYKELESCGFKDRKVITSNTK